MLRRSTLIGRRSSADLIIQWLRLLPAPISLPVMTACWYQARYVSQIHVNTCQCSQPFAAAYILFFNCRTTQTLLPYAVGTLLAIPLRVLSFGSHLANKLGCRGSCLILLQRVDNQRHIITVIATLISYAAHILSFVSTAHSKKKLMQLCTACVT